MKIYTKTGDTGQTSLVGGSRVSKGVLKIDAFGNVDELNAWMGVLRDLPANETRKAVLKEIQDRLFTIGADLASESDVIRQKKVPDLLESDVAFLEKEMDDLNENLPPLHAFVLPGGDLAVSYAHVARTVCRRAERSVIRLTEIEEVNPLIIKYLNRLSDYLFVLSRAVTYELGVEEVTWQPRK